MSEGTDFNAMIPASIRQQIEQAEEIQQAELQRAREDALAAVARRVGSEPPEDDDEPEIHPDQLTLDPDAAREARDDGERRAMSADRVQTWKDEASAWLERMTPGTTFDSDEVVTTVGLPDTGANRNNVVGAWISAQARKGRIVHTGSYRPSQRPTNHGAILKVWRVA